MASARVRGRGDPKFFSGASAISGAFATSGSSSQIGVRSPAGVAKPSVPVVPVDSGDITGGILEKFRSSWRSRLQDPPPAKAAQPEPVPAPQFVTEVAQTESVDSSQQAVAPRTTLGQLVSSAEVLDVNRVAVNDPGSRRDRSLPGSRSESRCSKRCRNSSAQHCSGSKRRSPDRWSPAKNRKPKGSDVARRSKSQSAKRCRSHSAKRRSLSKRRCPSRRSPSKKTKPKGNDAVHRSKSLSVKRRRSHSAKCRSRSKRRSPSRDGPSKGVKRNRNEVERRSKSRSAKRRRSHSARRQSSSRRPKQPRSSSRTNKDRNKRRCSASRSKKRCRSRCAKNRSKSKRPKSLSQSKRVPRKQTSPSRSTPCRKRSASKRKVSRNRSLSQKKCFNRRTKRSARAKSESKDASRQIMDDKSPLFTPSPERPTKSVAKTLDTDSAALKPDMGKEVCNGLPQVAPEKVKKDRKKAKSKGKVDVTDKHEQQADKKVHNGEISAVHTVNNTSKSKKDSTVDALASGDVTKPDKKTPKRPTKSEAKALDTGSAALKPDMGEEVCTKTHPQETPGKVKKDKKKAKSDGKLEAADKHEQQADEKMHTADISTVHSVSNTSESRRDSTVDAMALGDVPKHDQKTPEPLAKSEAKALDTNSAALKSDVGEEVCKKTHPQEAPGKVKKDKNKANSEGKLEATNKHEEQAGEKMHNGEISGVHSVSNTSESRRDSTVDAMALGDVTKHDKNKNKLTEVSSEKDDASDIVLPFSCVEGQGLQYLSGKFNAWVPSKVTAVNSDTGCVQISLKKGYWFKESEMRSKLRHDGAHAGIGRCEICSKRVSKDCGGVGGIVCQRYGDGGNISGCGKGLCWHCIPQADAARFGKLIPRKQDVKSIEQASNTRFWWKHESCMTAEDSAAYAEQLRPVQ